MFYRLDSTRITLKEYWWGMPNPLVFLGWMAKWLRIRLPGSVDDPPVESLEPFRVDFTELPRDACAEFAPVDEDLRACGFHSPECYWIRDTPRQTDIYQVVYPHESGKAFARVQYRVWKGPKPARQYRSVTFLSRFRDGSWLISTTAKPDMLAPPSCRVNRKVGAPVEGLWASHQRELEQEQFAKTLVPIRDERELTEAVETHHAAVRDFHVQRGVFVPMDEDERRVAVAEALPGDETTVAATRHPAVLAEIERLQKKGSSWLSTLVILGLSVAVFVGVGAAQWSWEVLLMLVPILFVHELGHYAAMRVFRYQNVRMFFIPLFGAAVSGRHYNVPGWKKTIVSLMGPLPGIFLAVVIGVAGLVLSMQPLVALAVLALFLNGFNLLPILPLDGGWVMHSLYFSRHYVLDVGFRILAAAGLMIGSALLGDKVLFFFGLAMAFGLPAALRLLGVVRTIRGRPVPSASADGQSIPPETADAIIDEIERRFPQPLAHRNLARLTVQAYEAINARPPGWLATLLLTGVYLGSFAVALVAVAIFTVALHFGVENFLTQAMEAPRNRVDAASLEVRRGPGEPAVAAREETIVATFAEPIDAKAAFDRFGPELPPRATLLRFGQSLVLTLPAEDKQAAQQWSARLAPAAGEVQVASDPRDLILTLTAIAPDERAADEIEQRLRGYLVADGLRLAPPWHPDPAVAPLGELPAAGEAPNAAGRFSAVGVVARTGLILHVTLTFDRLVDGPPAVVKWLAALGCAEMRYRFDKSPFRMIKEE